jgi:hypothetical protein
VTGGTLARVTAQPGPPAAAPPSPPRRPGRIPAGPRTPADDAGADWLRVIERRSLRAVPPT